MERPVASAAYGFDRFIDGGLAPYAAGRLAEHTNLHVPFAVGAGAIVLGIVILTAGHRDLVGAERRQAELDGRAEPEAGVTEAAEVGRGRSPRGRSCGAGPGSRAAALPGPRGATTCAALAKKRPPFLRGGA
ncbi:hypothetical protein [Actinomadura sp. WMMA1423]|uniref:hypothetical protein n=1 Tax=Actinomadura sp. WMMA1423 TaxID=2591108 RepID=UPI00197AB9FB|nr:hypothetical protein [Actinomadura sp. WMMA1423]